MEAERKKQVMSMKIRVTSENYRQEVLESDIPVLVEFFADWCSKCAIGHGGSGCRKLRRLL